MPRRAAGRVALTLALLGAIPAIAAFDAPPATAAGPCPNADANVAQVELSVFEASVLCVVNQRRAENGLRPLRPNALLHDAAWIYATSMLSGGFYGHHGDLVGGSKGSTTIKRLRFLGYIRPGWAWIVGETLREARPETSTPSLVVDEWMASPRHRVEILKPRFREVGVSAVRGIADGFPYTQGVTVAGEFGFRNPRK